VFSFKQHQFLSVTKKQTSFLNLELKIFNSRLKNYRVFLCKTQNFIFKSIIFCFQASLFFAKFLIEKSTLLMINWASVERHVYKLQRTIFLNNTSRITLVNLQKIFLTSIAAHLFVVRSILNSKISLNSRLDAYQKFNLAVSFDALGLSDSSFAIFNHRFKTYVKQCLLYLILEPQWVSKFLNFQISSGMQDSFASYSSLKILLELAPKYILRLDTWQILKCIKPTVFLSFFSLISSEISAFILNWLDFFSGAQNSFSSTYNFKHSFIFSLFVSVIAYRMLAYVLTQTRKKSFHNFTSVKTIFSKGTLLFVCNKWFVMLNLEIKIERWLNYILRAGWRKNTIFSYYHSSAAKKFFRQTPGFEFSGFFITTFYRKVGLHKELVFFAKPSRPAVSELLYKIKYVLQQFTKLQVVVFHIRRILVDWFFYYSSCSLNRSFYSRLFFQIRYKLICWSSRKYSHLKSHFKYRQHVQFIIRQLKFRKFKNIYV
jgi:hypothetical protein